MRSLHCLLIVLCCLTAIASGMASSQTVFIRANQLGFLRREMKGATILSRRDLNGQGFEIVRPKGTRPVYRATIGRTWGRYGKFGYVHHINFSSLIEPGTYAIRAAGQESFPFAVGDSVYNRVVDSLMAFFRVQRCGATDPLLHGPCHTHDATRLTTDGTSGRKKVDASGGWHDAGDYVKFLNTAAYTTYTLLFAYEFNPQAFGFDHNTNGIPDVLDEAKIGLDWLLKLHVEERSLITQVQDLRDHDQGWRLPEEDALARDRPGFVGIGKNLVGIYSAVMACAYRIWNDNLHDQKFADRCLTAAEDLYSLRKEIPDIDSSGTGMYRDVHYRGKLALAACELYQSTKRPEYLQEAKMHATVAGSDYWWSWGDINSYAHYRLAQWDKGFTKYLRSNLEAARKLARGHAFGEASPGQWGSNNANLGAALQAILWRKITGETTFDSLATQQRDFILGRNPWGISFIFAIGTNFAKHFHSQVAHFNGGYLPGALAAGPVTAATLSQYPIPFERKDAYEEFQSDASVYRDDRMDYVTNEPTITAAATALFVLGVQSSRNQTHSSH
jgi:endoglucanase